MNEKKLMEVLSAAIAIRRNLKATITLIDALETTMVKPKEQLPETPPPGQIDAKRLDRIWEYLQGWIPGPMHEELQAFAKKAFGYRYYIFGQKYPADLRPAVCDKLNTFTNEQLTELEKILEAVH